MAVMAPLRILRVEDMPGVLEASWFRRRCIDATANLDKADREPVRGEALAVVACAASAWRSASWRQSCERVWAGERAREQAMQAFYRLYREGKVSSQNFDRVAVANAELRTALALLVVQIRERRHKWDG
jgi:hypothetical protein